MPQYKLSDGTSTYTLDSEYDLTDDELTEAAKQLFKDTTPVSQPQPQSQPQSNENQVLTGEVQQNIRQELDKKGRVHFIDADTGEEIKSNLNPLQKVGRNLKATGENIRSFMTQDYGEPLKARQKAGAMVLSSLLPAGQGIGAMALSGALGSGLYSGAEQFIDEGKIKPSKLAIDTALGGALGGALGLGGKYIGKQIAKAQRKNEVLKRRKLNFEERMTPEQKANYEAKLDYQTIPDEELRYSTATDEELETLTKPTTKIEETSPSQYGVVDNSQINQQLADQVNEGIKNALSKLDDYNNYLNEFNSKYGSVDNLRTTLKRQLDEYGMVNLDMQADLNNLLAKQKELSEIPYIDDGRKIWNDKRYKIKDTATKEKSKVIVAKEEPFAGEVTAQSAEMPTMTQTAENITPEEQITKNIGNEIKPRQSAKTVESASGIKLEDEDILNYEVRHQQDLINKAKSLSPEERNNIIHSDRLDDEATAVRIAELQLAKGNGQVPSTALLNKLVTSGTEQGQALSMRQQLNAYSPEGAILAIRKGNLEGVSKQAKTVIGNSEKIAKELQPLMETSPENAAVEAQFNKWLEEMPNKIKKQYSQKGDKLALMKAMEKHRVSMAKKEMAAIEKYSNQKVKEKAKQQLKEKLALEREEAKAIKQLLKEEQKKHANIQKVLTKFGASEKASRSIIKELMTLKQNEGLTQENLATILDRAYGVKQISKQDLDEITKLTDAVANTAEGTREQDIARGFVDKFINEKIPKSTIKKVNSFRYQNMLNSPKSRFKDIITSAATAFDTNVVVPTLANAIDIGRVTLGRGLGKVYRPLGDFFGTQRAFAGPQIKAALGGLKKGTSEGWGNAVRGIETPRSGLTYNYDLPSTAFAYKQLGDSWKDISNIADTAKAIANNIPAVGEQVMNGLIRIPDRAFYEMAYAQSLANQMKAAGVSEPTEVMVNQAVKEAKEAIFQEVSKISQLNNKVRETFNSIVPGLGDIEIPFPTTPGNLLGLGLKRTYGIPAAIARHFTDFIKSGGEGLTQQQIRDNTNLAAQGILGGVPAAIGTAQGLGWLAGNLGNTDYKENEVSGLQPQSVVIPGTDYAVSFKNTPMFSIPAAISAAETRAIVEGLDDIKNSNASPEAKQYAMVLANALLQSGSAGTKAFTEQSAMKPLGDTMRMVSEGGYYSDDPKGEIQRAAEGLGEVFINTGLQLNPYSSLRNEWGNIKNPQAAELQTDNWIDYAGNRWKNSSITGREDLPPKYSALGTPVMRNNLETPTGRALSEAFDFGVRKYNREDTEKYRDLENFSKQAKKAKISGYKKLGAKKLERSVKLPDKTEIKLTNEQYSEAQRVYGKMQDYFKTTLLYDQNISNKKRVDDMKEYDTAAKQVALYSVLGDKYSVKKPSKYLNRVIKYYNENLYEK